MTTFDFNMLLFGKYHDWLLSGFFLTAKLTAIALAISIPLAIVIAILRLSPHPVLRAIGVFYVESIRNVPLLVHMLFWYFGAPQFLPEPVKAWLYEGNIESISAVIALVLYSAAYMSEDIRSGIRSIPKEQMEASSALGFSFLKTMKLVILPQSLRITIPPLISQTLNLWKNTSIAMVIGVAELMYQTQQVENATFKSYEAFAFATFVYLTISLMITGIANLYQRRFQVRSV